MTRRKKIRLMLALLAGMAGSVAAAPWLLSECEVCEAATTILLSGTVLGKCSVNVTAAPQAVQLAIDVASAQRVLVATALQNCTGTRSYILTMSSMNCAASPAGGKIMDTVSGDYLRYSGEFTNPPTGGSQTTVTGLLASSCTGQVGRTVTSANISNENSQIYVNFTGSPDLAAGTYQDVVTISLNMQ